MFNDNCIHLAHNALAAAGLWRVWPIGQFLPFAMFNFPVPRNEFVNLARRLNDHWLPDPGAVYRDVVARDDLLAHAQLPTMPGGLVEAQGPLLPNQVYDTTLKMIFMDEPTFGSYQANFDRIFAEPRYLDPVANRSHFALLARQALAERQPLAWWTRQAPYNADPDGFARVYKAFYDLMHRLAAP